MENTLSTFSPTVSERVGGGASRLAALCWRVAQLVVGFADRRPGAVSCSARDSESSRDGVRLNFT